MPAAGVGGMNGVLTGLFSAALSALLWSLARLPDPLRRGFTRAAGFVYVATASRATRTIVTNVEHVSEGLQAAGVKIVSPAQFARENLRFTAGLLAETAICWRGPENAWRDLIHQVHGDEAIEVLTRARKRSGAKVSTGGEQDRVPGVLLLSPHMGNWEVLNMYLGAEFGLTVLYDPPKITALDPVIRRARERTKSTVLPIGPAGLRGLLQRLRAGAVVGLLPDQVPDLESGVLAEFFGKQALTINLVHRLASRNQPRVFLVTALRNSTDSQTLNATTGEKRGYDIYFDELTQELSDVSEAESARAMNAAIERRVSQAPEQYQWSYKRFRRVAVGVPNIYNGGNGGR